MASHIRRLVAQQIVETVKDVCGHDINYIDPNGIIFASTTRSESEPITKSAVRWYRPARPLK